MFEGTVPSKERLVFHTGFRTFEGRPIFSENNLNCDKHKFSRFLHKGEGGDLWEQRTGAPCPWQSVCKGRDNNLGSFATDSRRRWSLRLMMALYPRRALRGGVGVRPGDDAAVPAPALPGDPGRAGQGHRQDPRGLRCVRSQ
jgi:hypothetical protein